jgi:hypothetical protein
LFIQLNYVNVNKKSTARRPDKAKNKLKKNPTTFFYSQTDPDPDRKPTYEQVSFVLLALSLVMIYKNCLKKKTKLSRSESNLWTTDAAGGGRTFISVLLAKKELEREGRKEEHSI